MPDHTVPTPDAPDRLTDEEQAAADRARLLERDIATMTRLYEAVGDMTGGADLAVMSDPGVVEAALALCETIAGRLRTSF